MFDVWKPWSQFHTPRSAFRICQGLLALAATKIDSVAALKAVERPSLATSKPASAEPIEQHEAGAGREVKLLTLLVARSGKGLDRVGCKYEQRASTECGTRLLAARTSCRIFVDLGRRLRA